MPEKALQSIAKMNTKDNNTLVPFKLFFKKAKMSAAEITIASIVAPAAVLKALIVDVCFHHLDSHLECGADKMMDKLEAQSLGAEWNANLLSHLQRNVRLFELFMQNHQYIFYRHISSKRFFKLEGNKNNNTCSKGVCN